MTGHFNTYYIHTSYILPILFVCVLCSGSCVSFVCYVPIHICVGNTKKSVAAASDISNFHKVIMPCRCKLRQYNLIVIVYMYINKIELARRRHKRQAANNEPGTHTVNEYDVRRSAKIRAFHNYLESVYIWC